MLSLVFGFIIQVATNLFGSFTIKFSSILDIYSTCAWIMKVGWWDARISSITDPRTSLHGSQVTDHYAMTSQITVKMTVVYHNYEYLVP